MKLNHRQQTILRYIKRYSAEHGYPPTVRDIGRAVGLRSPSTVHAHLANLEGLGALRRDRAKPRAIEMLLGQPAEAGRSATLPLVGRVAAGEPVLAEQNIEEHVEIPAIAGGEEGDYVLRIAGDSMRGAGILEGDHVVVRHQEDAQDGDIVVALVGEEATVKRFFKESDHVRLEPENEDVDAIRSRQVRVIGRVVGVFRRIG